MTSCPLATESFVPVAKVGWFNLLTGAGDEEDVDVDEDVERADLVTTGRRVVCADILEQEMRGRQEYRKQDS